MIPSNITPLFIRSHIANSVMHIHIARPEKKNAISQAMYQTMTDIINTAVTDSTVNSLLLYGEPNFFTAGNDLEDLLNNLPTGLDSPIFQFMMAVFNCPKPVIVAVNGVAVGIGATLLLHADLVYAADNAVLSMPFVNLGLCAEFGSSLLLPALCGTAKAAEKLLLGEPISAEEAFEMGIVTQVLAPDKVLPYAIQKAEKFANLSPDAVCTTKRLMRTHSHAAIKAAITAEAEEFTRLLNKNETQATIQTIMRRKH